MRALPIALGFGAMIVMVGRCPSIECMSRNRQHARSVTEFSTIGDDKEHAIALFNEAGKVILNPRCVNCHPRVIDPGKATTVTPTSRS